jgi:anti-sigma-K factor RskA
MNTHDAFLDDVAVYALGALPRRDVGRVSEHLRTCAECREEYARVQPVVTALASSAEACERGENGPQVSPSLRSRIMAQVRRGGAPAVTTPRRRAALLWPAYLVAAACLAIALISTVLSLSLTSQLRTAQTQLALEHQQSNGLSHRLRQQQTTIADLMSVDAQRYDVRDGQVVRRGNRLYIAMHAMPMPPKGKVYQAWTMAKGGKTMEPSVTFMPDRAGVAVVSLPVDAQRCAEVAVSTEPDGGSKQPTSSPAFVVTLN